MVIPFLFACAYITKRRLCNIQIFSDVKIGSFEQFCNVNIFKNFAQNIDSMGVQDVVLKSSPQAMFWSKNKKKMYTCYPSFHCIKVWYRWLCLHDKCQFCQDDFRQSNTKKKI